jgi:hypothetical protein
MKMDIILKIPTDEEERKVEKAEEVTSDRMELHKYRGQQQYYEHHGDIDYATWSLDQAQEFAKNSSAQSSSSSSSSSSADVTQTKEKSEEPTVKQAPTTAVTYAQAAQAPPQSHVLVSSAIPVASMTGQKLNFNQLKRLKEQLELLALSRGVTDPGGARPTEYMVYIAEDLRRYLDQEGGGWALINGNESDGEAWKDPTTGWRTWRFTRFYEYCERYLPTTIASNAIIGVDQYIEALGKIVFTSPATLSGINSKSIHEIAKINKDFHEALQYKLRNSIQALGDMHRVKSTEIVKDGADVEEVNK